MKNKICTLLLLPLVLLAGCQVGDSLQITEENAIELCLDEANLREEDVTEISSKQKDDVYIIKYDYNNKHYKFEVSTSGEITSRDVKKFSEEELEEIEAEKIKEEVKKTPKVALADTEKGKQIIQASLDNAGVTKDMVEKLSIVQNEDKTYTVKFTIYDGNTVVTIADKDGNLISSNFM